MFSVSSHQKRGRGGGGQINKVREKNLQQDTTEKGLVDRGRCRWRPRPHRDPILAQVWDPRGYILAGLEAWSFICVRHTPL